MPEELVPPVVAVVVSEDPGPWLEECLASLVAQDYRKLSILVVDAASSEPLASRVAAVVPDAYFYRLEENLGFGPSANVVTRLVEGSTHFLFCHDDVVLEPDCVLRMVEEAFRSNAGIVAPKLVDYDEPDLILQLGLSVDRFGAPVRRVGHREFDQAQHDEVREVFAAPGGCTLVRSDLFIAIGGFDEQISMFGEDVDLCWRARLAGARVVVTPSAVARHLEASASRRRPMSNGRGLQWRHELRAVLKNYGPLRRWIAVAELAILSVIEIVYFLALGRRARARQVIDAWRWNFSAERNLRAARQQVRAARRLPDHVVCKLLTRRSARATRHMLPLIEQYVERRAKVATEGVRRELAHVAHRRDRRTTGLLGTAVAVVLVLVIGSRSLIFGHLPLVGELLPLPGPATLLGHYFGGFENAGLQTPGPASPALLMLGLSGLVLGGAMGIVLKIWIAIAIVGGAFGVARLVRPLGPPSARLWAAVAYLFLPLAWDDIGRGQLLALVAYGGLPYVLRRLFAATGLAPYGSGAPTSLRTIAGEALGLGVLVAFLAAFSPLVAILELVVAFLLFIGGVVLGEVRGGLRALAVGAGGGVVAFVLLVPWSITFVQRGVSWSAVSGAATDPANAPQLGSLLRLEVGPLGAGILGLAFFVAGLFALATVDSARFSWAARLWFVLLGSAALAWAASEGWIGAGGGAIQVFVAPLAVCIAALVGLGVGAFAGEIRRSHVGWRHIVAIGFAALLGAGLLPVLGGATNGRWGLPGDGYDAVLDWTSGSGTSGGSARVLWLGDPTVLPLPSWQISPGLGVGVSSGGLPDASRLFPSPNPGRATSLVSAIVAAESGRTVGLGAALAPAGIRYLVVPATLGPLLSGGDGGFSAFPPQLLLDALTAQSDLHELPSEGGALVFENTAWTPGAHLPTNSGVSATYRTLGVVGELALVGVLLLAYGAGRRRRRGRRGRHVRDAAPPESGQEVAIADPTELVAAGDRA